MRIRSQLAAIWVAAALGACSTKVVRFTPEDDQAGEVCDSAGDEDGNGLADCSDPACADAPSCQVRCGNSKLEAGEACDDGNLTDGDGCEADCTLPACGNSIVDPGEGCDHGASNGTAGDLCTAGCQLITCGNHVVDPGEQCDDASNGPHLRCNAMCRFNVCGDGDVLTGTEQCDGGANGVKKDTATCDSDCTLPACGDGHKNTLAGEQCDDGNTTDGDACENNCTLPVCGNGIRDPGEQCDGGAGGVKRDTATCDSDCTFAVCGDGHVNMAAGEVCDDGNALVCGSCNATCSAVTSAASATGQITAVPGANLNTGESFTLDDGLGAPVTFVFTTGPPGTRPIPVSPADTAAQVAASITNAINSSGSQVVATQPAGAAVALTNRRLGSPGNRPIAANVADPGFVVSGMSGGRAADCAPGVGCTSDLDCTSHVCNANHTCQ
jgi:cysteine-rich repeat protein